MIGASLPILSRWVSYLALPLTLAAVGAATPDANEDNTPTTAFSFASLQRHAQEMAARPHVPPKRVAEQLDRLTYDQYRMIAPRHDAALWREQELPYWAEFQHAGFLFHYPIEIALVEEGRVRELPFDAERWFQYRGEMESLGRSIEGGGFAGFRVLGQLPERKYMQEFVSFLGASYFRAIGSHQWYGASTRGLAIDIGLPTPEEFPKFRKFWIEKPVKSDETSPIRIWALLESPAVAGAYAFVIKPGLTTSIDVEAHLWFRHGVQKVGVAPITSMWMWNADHARDGDHRPEVHDSDGLLIKSDGRWDWRPLMRPETPRVSRLSREHLEGFGLMQRERTSAAYRDREAHYHLRPNVWITPLESWGPGRVELLELPSDHEGNDNIGAYWVRSDPAAKGDHWVLRYRIDFGLFEPTEHQVARVVETHVDRLEESYQVDVVYEFPEPISDWEGYEPHVKAEHGQASDPRLHRLGGNRARLRFGYEPKDENQQVIEAWISPGDKRSNSGERTSEVWSYRWLTP
ncbi:Glucans biosynthesis protein G precursor [Planctomycetes bacterium Pan216]|uniref:Glucans biosynthesis protein G n=1 Tax=Kolteria novifilia TaxID=2527975 RepID=A0A518AX45_9BACT|nr:Glucans biosynthesis protein G precursor [Planctomycetes bacterium Pan216]